VAFVAGAIIGGVITATLGWPWCFFLAAPFAIAAAALAPRAVPESHDEAGSRRLDVPGAVTVTVGLVLIVLAVVRADEHGLGAATTLQTFAAAGALLAAFAVIERRARVPLLRWEIVRGRLAGASLALTANAGAFTGISYLITLHVQQVLGYSPLEAGIALMPLAVSAAAGGILASRPIARFGPRATTVASLLLGAGALAFLSRISDEPDYATVLLPGFVVLGLAGACAFVSLMRQGMAAAGQADRGVASGLLETATHVGGALVLAILAAVAAGEGATAGIQTALLVGAGLLVAAAMLSARVPTER